MKFKQNIVSAAVAIACGGIFTQAQAVLPANAVLQFEDGVGTCLLGGTYPDACTIGVTNVPTGSWFAMDTDNNNIFDPGNKRPIALNAGFVLGAVQPATGSHPLPPDGSESPGIDMPWNFGGNTGMHQTTSAVTIITDDLSGNVMLDMAGWNVTWNNISSIPMGGDNANYPADPKQATLTCAVDCAVGDTFTLNYFAHVPAGDQSGFGNTLYGLYMVGTVALVSAPVPSEGGIIGGGVAGAGSTNMYVSMSDVVGSGITSDAGYFYGGGLFDFVVNPVTSASVQVQFTLVAPIPADAEYRKYINGAWAAFSADANNLIASAPKNGGICPPFNDAAYNHLNGLVKDDQCLQLTIEDDGPNDSAGPGGGGGANLGTVADPGGVAAIIPNQIDNRVGSTEGCSISTTRVSPGERADWWLIAGFLGLLGLFRFRRTKAKA